MHDATMTSFVLQMYTRPAAADCIKARRRRRLIILVRYTSSRRRRSVSLIRRISCRRRNGRLLDAPARNWRLSVFAGSCALRHRVLYSADPTSSSVCGRECVCVWSLVLATAWPRPVPASKTSASSFAALVGRRLQISSFLRARTDSRNARCQQMTSYHNATARHALCAVLLLSRVVLCHSSRGRCCYMTDRRRSDDAPQRRNMSAADF